MSYVDLSGNYGHLIAYAIQKFLEIEISEKESFSKNVCHNCNQKVEDWKDFYNKCHETQTLFKNTPLILEETTVQPETSSLGENNVSNDLSKLVEEFVQDSSPLTVETTQAVALKPSLSLSSDHLESTVISETNEEENAKNEENLSATEDEFEEEITSENESDELSDNYDESKVKQKKRQKKFIFTIPFLERKKETKFSVEEKVKLQKYISKRQNTLICKNVAF